MRHITSIKHEAIQTGYKLLSFTSLNIAQMKIINKQYEDHARRLYAHANLGPPHLLRY